MIPAFLRSFADEGRPGTEVLSVGPRARLWRIRPDDPTEDPFVVKQFAGRGDGPPGPTPDALFANECAALHALAGSGVTPRLLAADPTHLTLVVEDLGPGDNLFGRAARGEGAEGARSYARALARLHGAGHRNRVEFRSRRQRLSATPPYAHPLDSAAPAAAMLRAFAAQHDVAWDPVPAVSALADALRDDRGFLGVAVVDVCPDNVWFTGHGTRVLDLEFACETHVLVDAASFLLDFPNCGRELAIADAPSVVEEYRRALATELDAAGDPGRFAHTLHRCAVVWSVTAAAHRLHSRDTAEHVRGRRALAALTTSGHFDDPVLVEIAAGAGTLAARLGGSPEV